MPIESESNNNSATASAVATASSGGDAAIASSTMEQELSTSTCPDCSREVPTANLVLHEVTCGRARADQQQSSRQLQQSHESQLQQQTQQEETQTQLPKRERGQQTLDRWLSTSSSSSDRSGVSLIHSSVSSSNSNSGSNSTTTTNIATSTTESANSNTIAAAGTASFVGNIRPPETQSTNAQAQASQNSGAPTDNENTQPGEGQWLCSRCTLINQNQDSNCAVCLAPRNGNNNGSDPSTRPPDASTTERLVQEEENGWVNVTYNPQFRRGPNGIARTNVPAANVATNNNRFNIQIQNPLVHGGRLGTVTRMFNGLINGAIVGSVFAGPGGMVIGGIAGAMGGAMVDRTRNRQEEQEVRETRDVANMLVNDDGGINSGTVRVHRGDGHITALARDGNGRSRVIRVRYDGPSRPAVRRELLDARLGSEGVRGEIEQSLLEILVQMSYSRDFGPGPGDNVILQPEESFEELTRRFGLGNNNRGASPAIIESYPVEVVRREQVEEDCENENDGQKSSESRGEIDNEESSQGTDDTSALGTCGICLEDYKEGELKKTLQCPHRPHSFHKDCIGKWLKLVASCPMCKHKVEMYRGATSKENEEGATGEVGRDLS